MVAQSRKSSKSNSPAMNEGANNMNTVTTINAVSASASTNAINQENIMNTATTIAKFALDNMTVRTTAPRINLAQEQIDAKKVADIFLALVVNQTIGFTNAPNRDRSNGLPVIYFNWLQMDQLARAIALYDMDIYQTYAYAAKDSETKYVLWDKKGDQDRVVTSYVGGDGKMYFRVNYAHKMFRQDGALMGHNEGAPHMISASLQKRAEWFNGKINEHKEAARAVAAGTATDEQREMMEEWGKPEEDPNRYVQVNTNKRGINGDLVMNKYELLVKLLMAANERKQRLEAGDKTPVFAFRIHTYVNPGKEDAENSMENFFKKIVGKMEKPFKHELQALAGLVSREATE